MIQTPAAQSISHARNGLSPVSASRRRADLDWLRVLALALLIVLHVLLAYVPGAWLVRSHNAGDWALAALSFLSHWRMELVFLIGGAATRFLLEKNDLPAFIHNRVLRLLVPFVFAVVVIIPPQFYVQPRELDHSHGSYLRYWLTGAWFDVDFHGILLPEIAHVWFLLYLFVYSTLIAVVWKKSPRLLNGAQRRIEALPLAVIVVGFMLWFSATATILEPIIPRTRLFLDDISGHFIFVGVFLFGFLVARSDVFWGRLRQGRRAVWLVTFAFLGVTIALFLDHHRGLTMAAAQGAYAGSMLLSILAFGDDALTMRPPALGYATDAVLPVYILHQTVLVVIGAMVAPLRWPLAVELPLLLAVTSMGPLLAYHFVIRETPWLRFLFGMRPFQGKEQTRSSLESSPRL